MTAPTVDDAVSLYVLACEQFLDDLDEETRTQLRVDIAEIVAEVCGELDGEPADLVGPPFRFVNELRVAAGVGARQPSGEPPGAAPPGGRAPRKRLRDRVGTAWGHPAMRWTRGLVPELRPAWWVARGVLFAWLIGEVTGGSSWWLFDVVPMWSVFGSRLVGLATVAGGVYVSVEAGRRRPTGRRRFAMIAASIVSVVFGVSVVSDLSRSLDRGVTYVSHDEQFAAPPFGSGLPGATFRPVQLGSDVTDEVFDVIDMTRASTALEELLTTGPPAAIWIQHDGVQLRPGTQAAIEQELQRLAADGYLNP